MSQVSVESRIFTYSCQLFFSWIIFQLTRHLFIIHDVITEVLVMLVSLFVIYPISFSLGRAVGEFNWLIVDFFIWIFIIVYCIIYYTEMSEMNVEIYTFLILVHQWLLMNEMTGLHIINFVCFSIILGQYLGCKPQTYDELGFEWKIENKGLVIWRFLWIQIA